MIEGGEKHLFLHIHTLDHLDDCCFKSSMHAAGLLQLDINEHSILYKQQRFLQGWNLLSTPGIKLTQLLQRKILYCACSIRRTIHRRIMNDDRYTVLCKMNIEFQMREFQLKRCTKAAQCIFWMLKWIPSMG